MGKVLVRPYGNADRAAVVALWREVFADDPPWNEPEGIIERKLTVQPQLFLVAEVEGRVVGTVLGGFDGVRGWIHHLAVQTAHRRKGVARLLMRAAEDGLKNLGCPKVNLQVRASNLAVIEFYRSLGYNVEERASLGKRLAAV
jgi:ribosomal protein S18 acetylase RimI-like enzyme